MAKRKRASRSRTTVPTMPQQLGAGLSAAKAYMRRKRWGKARELLESLNQRYPNQVDVLTALTNVCYETKDVRGYLAAIEPLARLSPDDPDVTIGLAGAYMANVRPASALRTFRRFLDRWPDHERAAEISKTMADLEAKMDEFLADQGLPRGEEGLELAELHEEVQSRLDAGEHDQARKLAGQLLDRYPNFAPALNNLSLAYLVEGNLDQAIATAKRVLAFDPDNFHALSNLTRLFCMRGRLDEAREYAERLKAVESNSTDVWMKKAEALSYLGDDRGVLEAFHGAEQAGYLEPPLANPLLYHLAAVATMRLGSEDEARRYWQQALKLWPGFQPARDNVEDLRKPVGERHAPWAFSLSYWVPDKTMHDLVAQTEPATGRGNEEALTKAMRRFLQRHPEVASLVPLLLDRGDPRAREFALRVALIAETPELLEALRDFALSPRGPDEMRLQAAQAASEAGLFPSGLVRFWQQGEWSEVMLMGFELHDEPIYEHAPQVVEWLQEGTLALKEGDAKRAERLLKRALEVEPDAPDLLNNLAAAYELQGRMKEAEALVRKIHERHPDYVFACTGLAGLHVRDGEFDKAEELLKPLLSRQRFHFEEFAALCQAQIQLNLAKDNPEAAETWFDMWADADPDNPKLEYWRQRVKPEWRQRLFRRRRS